MDGSELQKDAAGNDVYSGRMLFCKVCKRAVDELVADDICRECNALFRAPAKLIPSEPIQSRRDRLAEVAYEGLVIKAPYDESGESLALKAYEHADAMIALAYVPGVKFRTRGCYGVGPETSSDKVVGTVEHELGKVGVNVPSKRVGFIARGIDAETLTDGGAKLIVGSPCGSIIPDENGNLPEAVACGPNPNLISKPDTIVQGGPGNTCSDYNEDGSFKPPPKEPVKLPDKMPWLGPMGPQSVSRLIPGNTCDSGWSDKIPSVGGGHGDNHTLGSEGGCKAGTFGCGSLGSEGNRCDVQVNGQGDMPSTSVEIDVPFTWRAADKEREAKRAAK